MRFAAELERDAPSAHGAGLPSKCAEGVDNFALVLHEVPVAHPVALKVKKRNTIFSNRCETEPVLGHIASRGK